jgi:outer membrane protein TolC
MRNIFYLFLLTIPLFSTTLNELTQYALKHSTTIKQTASQVELAKLKRKESSIQQFGELNIVGDYTHYNTERTLAPLSPTSIGSGEPITTTKDLMSAGLSYTVPLFTGFAQTRQIEIDDIASQMAVSKMQLTKEQLVYNIRSLYLAILSQKEILRAQNRYTVALVKLAKQIKYEVQLGKKATIDSLKAEADVASSRTQQEMFKSNIETTKATLASLVGKPVKQLKRLNVTPKKPHYSTQRLFQKATHLTKVKVDEMAVKKAEKIIAKSKASKLPQVNLNSYIGKNYGEDIKLNEWDNETLWQVGVNVKYNLVDFGKRDIGVQKAKIAKMDALFKKEQTLLDLKKLIIEAVEQIKLSYAQYRGNLAQYKLGKKSEKIERVRYENDASTINDLLLAKGKSQLAYAKLIESKYNYQKSKYYLDYIMERGVKE